MPVEHGQRTARDKGVYQKLRLPRFDLVEVLKIFFFLLRIKARPRIAECFREFFIAEWRYIYLFV
ncbi:hypothetical protein AQZ49_06545 [Novosphingobium sp. FSW06-99]|nr:hypothetical protein AQZ49_06545 [Novosphingobium sp. FSW06-99]